MAKRLLRKTLSAPGLLRVVRACFDEVNDPVSGRRFSLSDCLMSGLAVFGLKYRRCFSSTAMRAPTRWCGRI